MALVILLLSPFLSVRNHNIKITEKVFFPNSLGIFYHAMTQFLGFKNYGDEYKIMGMAAYGEPVYLNEMREQLVDTIPKLRFRQNLHIGVGDDFLPNADPANIASTAQFLVESMIRDVLQKARQHGRSRNLVYGGGVALNCLANRFLGQYYEKIWIMPNPGDAGSSLGAGCLAHGGRVNWRDSVLGHNIPGAYPVNEILDHLVTGKIVGVASGRAEFGPRALGNRSLLCAPTDDNIKKLNSIKMRDTDSWRPYAPVCQIEEADNYFKVYQHSKEMLFVADILEGNFKTHDNTARLQTVTGSSNAYLWKVLEKTRQYGYPILINTSLNAKGKPIVNTVDDFEREVQLYD